MAKNKKNKKSVPTTNLNKKELKKLILDRCYDDPKRVLNYKKVASELGIQDPVLRQLVSVSLEELVDDGYLEQKQRGNFTLKERTGYIVGTIDMTQKGHAYLMSDETAEDIFIPAANLNRALNGDKVRVYLNAKRKKKQPEGEVVEIIERAKTNFVGTVSLSRNFAFLIPAGKNNFDISSPKEKLKGATQDKSSSQITEWPHRPRILL